MILTTFALLLFFNIGLAQDFKNGAITNPAISRRCDALLEKRNKKIKHKQKLNSLITRNLKVQKITPKEKRSIRQKLLKNLRHLEHELRITLVQIQKQEENIIRKGCPGITL